MDRPDPHGPTYRWVYHLTGLFQLHVSSPSCLGCVLSSNFLTCFPLLASDSLARSSPGGPPPHARTRLLWPPAVKHAGHASLPVRPPRGVGTLKPGIAKAPRCSDVCTQPRHAIPRVPWTCRTAGCTPQSPLHSLEKLSTSQRGWEELQAESSGGQPRGSYPLTRTSCQDSIFSTKSLMPHEP